MNKLQVTLLAVLTVLALNCESKPTESGGHGNSGAVSGSGSGSGSGGVSGSPGSSGSAGNSSSGGVSDVLTKHEILHRIREKIQTKPNIVNGKPIIQRNPCYELNLSGKNAFKLMNLMYSNSRLHMPRKYNIYLSIVDYLSTYKDGRIYK